MTLSKVAFVALGAALAVEAQIPDFTPPTPLFREILRNDTGAVKKLLGEGVDPNSGDFVGFKPIFFAVMHQNLEMVRAMVAKGADVKVCDMAGSTTLMWAAYNEEGNTALIEELLRLGVDPNAKNAKGETALMWALRRGPTPAVEALRKAGANEQELITASISKALALLDKSGPQFVRVSGCESCHNQSLPQMAIGIARSRGVAVNADVVRLQSEAVIAMFRAYEDEMSKGTDRLPNPPISVSYALHGLAAGGYPADKVTAAMAHLVATKQAPDGSFRVLPVRPPLEFSNMTATALSLRALQLYGQDPEDAVRRAGKWLRSAQPRSNEDRAMQLLGMRWAGIAPEHLREKAGMLLREQRPDGGWAQLPGLETDAYATGQALVALRESGAVAETDPAYRRGVTFLLRTQLADGSWLVRSRSFPLQPYKESGFPHGKNQWISAAGTSWAVMALSGALPAPEQVSGF